MVEEETASVDVETDRSVLPVSLMRLGFVEPFQSSSFSCTAFSSPTVFKANF